MSKIWMTIPPCSKNDLYDAGCGIDMNDANTSTSTKISKYNHSIPYMLLRLGQYVVKMLTVLLPVPSQPDFIPSRRHQQDFGCVAAESEADRRKKNTLSRVRWMTTDDCATFSIPSLKSLYQSHHPRDPVSGISFPSDNRN
jgi:hypothetical protein